MAYTEKGMYDQANGEFTYVLKLSKDNTAGLGGLGLVYALSGKREQAVKIIEELLERSKKRYVANTQIAMIYTAPGDNDKAFEYLEKGNTAHDLTILRIKAEPRFQQLRSDPRYDDLVKRVGIP